MYNYNNGVLTLSIPEIDWAAISSEQWLLMGLGVSVVYGFITHLHSLPRIRRWNKSESGSFQIGEIGLVFLLVYRLFLNIPVRIACFIAGTALMGLIFVASGKPGLNSLLRWGWHWHITPEMAQRIMKSNGLL